MTAAAWPCCPIVLGLLVWPASASADETPTGFEFGLRAGYAFPLGHTGGYSSTTTTNSTGAQVTSIDDYKLSDVVTGQIPIRLDVGYRFTPNIYAGGFFQYGIAIVPNDVVSGCGQFGVTCSGHDIVLGVDAQWHLAPDRTIDPWLGFGLGFEVLDIEMTGPGGSELSLPGLQFVDVQLGADDRVLPTLGVGPFASITLGSFQPASSSPGGSSQSSLYGWLTVGVRAVYDAR
jgi:hypothetical protein